MGDLRPEKARTADSLDRSDDTWSRRAVSPPQLLLLLRAPPAPGGGGGRKGIGIGALGSLVRLAVGGRGGDKDLSTAPMGGGGGARLAPAKGLAVKEGPLVEIFIDGEGDVPSGGPDLVMAAANAAWICSETTGRGGVAPFVS